MWLITLPSYTSGLEPTFCFPHQLAALPDPQDLSSLTLLLKQSNLIDPNTALDRIEFLDEDMKIIPKDTPVKKVMEWVGYENPLIVRVQPEVEVSETEEEKVIEEIEKEFEEEKA